MQPNANTSAVDVGREVIDRIVARHKVELTVLTTREVRFARRLNNTSMLNSGLNRLPILGSPKASKLSR